MLVDEFLMWEKRSELEGSNDLSMVSLKAVCLAALSTLSLPGIPLYPGAHMKTIDIEVAIHVSRMCRGWEAVG